MGSSWDLNSGTDESGAEHRGMLVCGKSQHSHQPIPRGALELGLAYRVEEQQAGLSTPVSITWIASRKE